MRITKEQKQGLVRGALVTAITLLIIIGVGFILTSRISETYFNIKGLYKANNPSVLFVGNSHAIAGIAAKQFDQITDEKSYNTSTTSQLPMSAELLVKEAIKTHDIDVVFVETFSMLFPSPSDYYYSKVLDADMSVFRSVDDVDNKILGMIRQRGLRRKFDAVLPLFKNHANWKTPENWHLRYLDIPLMQESKDNYLDNHIQGSRYISNILSTERLADYDDYRYNFNVNPNMAANKKYWDSIIALCQQNDIDVVFVTLPWLPQFLQNTNYTDITIAFDAYFNKKGIEHVDLNQVDLSLDHTDFAMEPVSPNQHLNKSGAKKATAYLADWYNKNYK